MGIERKVVEKRYRQGWHAADAPTYRFDYSTLEVGDWFVLVGGAVQRAFKTSRNGNPVAREMTFKTETTSVRTMRVERTG
ncbi:MAG TPA: hypothetical protein VIU82_21935 [Bosea sp. (in: a-proteobacteria)]